MSDSVAVNWLDHSRTFREQGVDENETLLLRRKFFYSDQNVDSRDPVQLNLLYVQVHCVNQKVLAVWDVLSPGFLKTFSNILSLVQSSRLFGIGL